MHLMSHQMQVLSPALPHTSLPFPQKDGLLLGPHTVYKGRFWILILSRTHNFSFTHSSKLSSAVATNFFSYTRLIIAEYFYFIMEK